MKRMLPILILVTVLAVAFTACNSRQDTAAEQAKFQAYKDSLNYATDTSGLAKYQAWKAQHELADISEYGKTTSPAVATAPVRKVIRTYVPVSRTTRSSSSSANSGSMTSESSNTAETVQKKGWSKAAKGAAIGGGAGAVIGAVLNKKNRVLGGVLGGVVGAGVGYGLGRGMDKKDGRY
jgi:hypothetical protein